LRSTYRINWMAIMEIAFRDSAYRRGLWSAGERAELRARSIEETVCIHVAPCTWLSSRQWHV
jgi:hypothetical protein